MLDTSHQVRFFQAFYHEANKGIKSEMMSEWAAEYLLNEKHALGLLNSFQA